jgi:omega-6 fatty acid desaturase (delta-12 desaturase)
MDISPPPPPAPEWYRQTKQFEQPSLARAVWQLLNTILPLAVCWGLMVWLLQNNYPYYFIAVLAIPSALLLVRLFMFFHDCGHGSFFKNPTANATVGWILGIVMFTAYRDWRRNHGIHHATNGNLDRRGVGEIWTMTLDEYQAASPPIRLWYRIYRNPVVLFLIAPPILFLILNRIPKSTTPPRERRSIWLTNLGVVAMLAAIGFWGGWEHLVLVYLPIFYLVWVTGLWLFYVQHQFDPGYWEHEDEWDPIEAALQGSSHYKLPKILQWFSGNIGLHHVHHLRPRIPNYNLERCYRATKELQLPQPLTIWRSLKSITLNVWDERRKMLISFGEAERLSKAAPEPA